MSNSKNTILGLFPDNDTNDIKAADLRQFVTAVFDEEVDTNEIQNTLTSNDTTKPLSALQGKVLDEKIDTEVASLTTDKEDALPTGTNGQFLSLVGGSTDWVDLTIPNSITVVDDLLSTSDTDALSANQGRILDENADVIDTKADTAQSTADDNITAIASINTYVGVDDSSGLSLRIKTNEDDIDTNEDDIITNANDISTLDSTVTPLISQNESDITDLENANVISDGFIQDNKDDIDALETLVGSINSTTLEARVTVNEGDIDVLEAANLISDGKISGNTGDIGTLELGLDAAVSDISDNEDNILVNHNAIAALETRATINEGVISANSNAITALEGEDTSLDIRITNNQNNIISNTNRISSHENDINSLLADRVTIFNDIAENSLAISGNATNIAILQSRVLANENDIVDLDGDIVRLDGVDSSLDARITTNEDDIDALEAAKLISDGLISDNAGDIDALETANITSDGFIQDNKDDIAQNVSDIDVLEGYVGTDHTDGLGAKIQTNINNIGTLENGKVQDNADAITVLQNDLNTNEAQTAANLDMINTKEHILGDPTSDGQVLASTAAGVRTWVSQPVLEAGVFSITTLHQTDDAIHPGSPFTGDVVMDTDFFGLGFVQNTSDQDKVDGGPIHDALALKADITAMDLKADQVDLEALEDGKVQDNIDDIIALGIAKENDLLTPGTNGWVLSSDTSGTRSWIPMAGSDGSGEVLSVQGKGGIVILTKVDFPDIVEDDNSGLDKVDNVADIDKEVSTATQTELDILTNGKEGDLGTGVDGQVLTLDTDGTSRIWLAPVPAPVTSVNGEVDVVVLDKTHIGLSNVEDIAVDNMNFDNNSWINDELDDKEDSLPDLAGASKVLTIAAGGATLEWAPTASTTTVYDGLDSTSTTFALSANQGRILNDGKEPTAGIGTANQIWATNAGVTGKEWITLGNVAVTSVNGSPGAITISTITLGLNFVDNTSDNDKVSGTNVIKQYIDTGDTDTLTAAELYADNAILGISAPVIETPMFKLPLINSHSIMEGVGSSSFTRTSDATHEDRYGTFMTSSTDEPRFDNSGILLEESSTNLFLNSAVGVTQSITVTSGNTYTLRFLEGAGTIDLTGADTTTGIIAGQIVTFTAGTTSLTCTVVGVIGKVQVEEKAMATSYIVTTGVTATRTSETLEHTSYDNMPNFADGGSIAVSFSTLINTQEQYIWSSYVDASNYIHIIQLASGIVNIQGIDGGATIVDLSYNPYTSSPNLSVGDTVELLFTTTGVVSDMFIDKVKVATDIRTITMPGFPTTSTVGCKSATDHATDITGHIRNLRFYDSKVL